MARKPTKTYESCTVIRRIYAKTGTLNIDTGVLTMPDVGEWETRPCGVPLFNATHRATGMCKGCSEGWAHEHSRPATDAEIAAYLATKEGK